MSRPYTFSTTLLSGQKFFPRMASRPLSASGVNVISLSTNDVGITFTPSVTLTGTLIDTTVEGSFFKIDSSYHNAQMALVKDNGRFTIFQFLTSGTVGVSLSANHRSVSNSETRRKRHLGY